MQISKIIKRSIVTEKSLGLNSTDNVYVFEVNKKASKHSIALEVSKLFNVEVDKVSTMVMPGKKKRIGRTNRFTRTPSWKKALVWVSGGKKIDVLAEG